MNRSNYHSYTDQRYKTNPGSKSTVDADISHDQSICLYSPIWSKVESTHFEVISSQYCPTCARLVLPLPEDYYFQAFNGRIFLAHSHCIIEPMSFTEFFRTARKLNQYHLPMPPTPKIGAKQLLVSVTIGHPLNFLKFYSSSQKLYENCRQYFYETNLTSKLQFEPNVILLPMKELSFSITYSDLQQQSNSENQKIKSLNFKVDISPQTNKIITIAYETKLVTFLAELEVITQLSEKQDLIQKMNFKYMFPVKEGDLVKFNRFGLIFGEIDTSHVGREKERSYKISWEENDIIEECEEGVGRGELDWDVVDTYSEMLIKQEEQTILESTSIDFSSNIQFINSIKTQTGSKQFQKNIKRMTIQQVQKTIQIILPHISEIILNDYGNYMFQSLLSTCTFEQRMRIINQIKGSLVKLVCEQQGTFVFQQLISYLTNLQQFECLCEEIIANFSIVALDNFGNHFLRKLIQRMPTPIFYKIMPNVLDNFVKYCKNKNAVCVMKCVLYALKEGEIEDQQIALQSKRVLDILTLNTQQLINDQYGNYIIQEAYIHFKAERLIGITEFILNFFSRNSCEKYASNVVKNCVSEYWKLDEGIYRELKNCLDRKNIINMYHNREGNRVLLEIMKVPFELAVKDKISSTVRNEQSSNFNNREWVKLTKNGKTGAVGTKYNNFTEASTKKKKYNN